MSLNFDAQGPDSLYCVSWDFLVEKNITSKLGNKR